MADTCLDGLDGHEVQQVDTYLNISKSLIQSIAERPLIIGSKYPILLTEQGVFVFQLNESNLVFFDFLASKYNKNKRLTF